MGTTRHFFRKTLTLVLTLFFTGALPPFAFPQTVLFNAQKLTTEEGLANLMATAVFKDQEGFIWIGTGYGLNRYDGYNFRLFTQEENGLQADKEIARIDQDSDGKLWLFYRDGIEIIPPQSPILALDIFDPKAGHAAPFDSLFTGNAPFKTSEILLPKILDPKKRVWIHTNRGELFRYGNGRFKKIYRQEAAFFQYISIDQTENLWLGLQDTLLSIDTLGNILEQVKLPGQVVGIWPGPDQTIWTACLAGPDNQFTIWHKKKNGPLTPFRLTKNGLPLQTYSKHLFLHRNAKGNWFINIEDQLLLFNTRGEWLFNFSTLLGKNQSTHFFSYFEDDDRLWFASATGVLKISARANRFQLIQRKSDKLSDCRGITEDEQGNIYFLNSQVLRWDVRTQKCQELPNSEGAAFALLHTDSLIWAGTYGVSPMGFELNLNTRQRLDYAPFDPDKFLVQSIAKSDHADRYLLGLNQGLAWLDLKAKKVLPFEGYRPGNPLDSALENCQVNFIHKNNAGYWLATDIGLFWLKENEGVIRHFYKGNGELPFDHIRHIHEDADGLFWLATKGGGVIAWRPERLRSAARRSLLPDAADEPGYRQFTTDDGLADNFTYAVYEDDFGKLWIPCDKGLMQMDKVSFSIRTFTTDDGLPHNEFNHTAHFQARNGALYFGGLGGLITFHPQSFADEPANSTPLEWISLFVLEGHADKMTNKSGLLSGSAYIDINPEDKFIELHFTLLDFDDVGKHRYAYRIEGYSDTWNYINENFIRITHLPYGDYTLRIRGQNSSLGWSDRELTMILRARKPFYLQWWFLAAMSALAAGAILAVWRWRIKELKSGKERLEAEVQKRTITIRQQAEALNALDKAKTRFFSNITHEFRTPLTLITGPLEQVMTDHALPTIFKRRIFGVLKNARHLLTLINQMLDLSKIEGGSMKAEVTRGDLVAYTKELVSRFQPLAGQKGLGLILLTPLDGWETNFDKDKWDKILYNLLSNAIKFTPADQYVQVSLTAIHKNAGDVIRLEVKDSGPGISEEHLPLIFDRFFQADNTSTRAHSGTGIGLALVKELVELQGGRISVKSALNQGATFEVLLPVLEAESARTLERSALPPLAQEDRSAPPPRKAPEDKAEKLELLLIEDNEEMREYIRYCIDPARYNITEAANGEEGILKAQTLIPDLIISDVMMPKKNGYEVTKAIRSHITTSHIPLILLTARASLESRLEGLQRGADAYLTKPFSPQELVLRISKLIEIRRLLQNRYQAGEQAADKDGPFQQEDEFIAALRTFVLERLDEPGLDGDRIGRHFGMSRVSLYRKLNALTGQSISDFVRATRLNKALELIRERKSNLSEIAYQTGFSSISAFSRAFKQAYGKAPSEM